MFEIYRINYEFELREFLICRLRQINPLTHIAAKQPKKQKNRLITCKVINKLGKP